MMEERVSARCGCPFCSRSLSFLMSLPRRSDFKLASWRTYLIIVLLLLGGCEARRLRTSRSTAKTEETSVHSNNLATKYHAQKFEIKASSEISELPNCFPLGKCRPCSRIDINRQLPECIKSGFKQRSFCSNIKEEKYTSCHYEPDPREARNFWLFEGSIFSVGVLAYAIVALRIRKMENMTARRIQEQINA